MGQDISSEISSQIANSTAFGNSDNIRCGRYDFLIKRTFAEKFDSGRYAIGEFKVLKSAPNPQILPPGVTTAQFDVGDKPNLVGSTCAMKVNFDGNGAKSAPGNVKAYVLGLFGLNQNDATPEDIDRTWKDLARLKDNFNNDGTPSVDKNNQPVAKRGNPSCGMVITCIASMKEKKKTKLLPPEQKEYVTVLAWECAAPGVNAMEAVAARRAELEASAHDDEEEVVAPAPMAAAPAPSLPAPPLPVAPPAIPKASFVPPAPWVKHPDAAWGNTPETQWFWDGKTGVMNLAQLQAGN